MITLTLNGQPTTFDGDPKLPLLSWLRDEQNVTSPKDGCSGQAACGACLVEVDGKAVLACSTSMEKLQGASVVTIEGFPDTLKRTLGLAFAAKGAVQCGFCTPGFLTRTKILLASNPDPTRDEVVRALRFHLCRCTGYVKIVEAVLEASRALREGGEPVLPKDARVGGRHVKLGAVNRALGVTPFPGDMRFPGMVHGALVFSGHPRAVVKEIDVSQAAKAPGVIRVFTAADVPGERTTGMLKQDWPIMVATGETTRYIGDVLASVAAETEALARAAARLIRVEYEVLEPVTNVDQALSGEVEIHAGGNVLSRKVIHRGMPVEDALAASFCVARGVFTTPAIEHGFLETECGLAHPEDGGVRVYSQAQGIWHDQEDISRMLGIPKDRVRVTHVDTGGAFGGKEDLSAQGHAALMAYLLERPAKVRFSRPESLRFHPKRHAMRMEYALGCDHQGRLTALKARIIGDTGAYASLGGPVMARAANHATGAYDVPCVDIESLAVFTNNIPAGAMRGFGVNQVTFAMESLVEELCAKGGFDSWEFRYANALDEGRLTASGQRLGGGIGLRKTLEAVKDAYKGARHAGLACAIKNSGIGGGVLEGCAVRLTVLPGGRVRLDHGWTEMGQGIDTVAAQVLGETLGWTDLSRIEVVADTCSGAVAGSTTASRGTFQLGRAVIEAGIVLGKAIRVAGDVKSLEGQVFEGRYVSGNTTADGEPGQVRSHVAYSFATHVAILDDSGKVSKVVAAHDAGRVINPLLCEGQVEGGVVMGLGYALSEKLPVEGGRLVSEKLASLGMLKIADVPDIDVILIEGEDPEGPYGAKGVGEIGSIPTAAAVANAFFRFDAKPRRSLPLAKPEETAQ
jgi:selenium-dependent xanthine dehydrogenase